MEQQNHKVIPAYSPQTTTFKQSLTDRDIEIAKVMMEVNAIKEFPLSDQMIILWSKKLVELRPWVSPEHLRVTINAFITGKLEWEKTEGVQNIIRGVQMVGREKK